jgi:hypothetical protein
VDIDLEDDVAVQKRIPPHRRARAGRGVDHDVEAIMRTWGKSPWYDDVA